MKQTVTLRRALSMLLTAAMVFNIGLPVFAEGTTPPGISGICTHHVEHTEDCGYQQGTPCGHTHTEDCYTKELTCKLIEGDAPEIATDSEATLDSGTAHTHGDSCYTKIDNCKHTHDEACGFTPDSPCTYDATSCTQCSPGDKPAEKVCTCPPVDSGELVHGTDCPLFAPQATTSEAVTALIAMVDALPNAADITEKNREVTLTDFEAALKAYEVLSPVDKAVFEATTQYKKLMALHTVLYPIALMANSLIELDITGADKYVNITATGYKVGTEPEIPYTGDYIITGTATSTNASWNHVMVSGGIHNITLKNADIKLSDNSKCAFVVENNSTVNLTLEGVNVLQSGRNRAGLEVNVGNTLTVTSASTGSLTATGGYLAAGCGGGNNGAGGTITISGGTVTATGGNRGAGIGGGDNSAGIGGGDNSAGGTITISGGTVTATGGLYGAGIGGGDNGAGGTITISGGTVTATGGQCNAGIGGGEYSAGGTITICGGTVTATGGQFGAGIGGGWKGTGGTITISDGRVTATGGDSGAGIDGGAGIGGGCMGAGGIVKIDGNTVVYAQKGTNAPNHIGEGPDGTPGTVTKAQGIIFEGDSGKVYGNSVTLATNTTISATKTLTLEEGHSLIIAENTTLTNNGTLSGTGFVSLLRSSARVNGSGTGNDTHVKRLLQEDNTTISNTTYDKLPAVKWDGITLTANTDFTVGNITTGTSVPVTVTGMGDYHGSVTKNIAVDAGSGGGDSGSDSTSTTLIPNQLSTAQTNAAIITNENGIVTAKADDQDILNAIETAQKSEKQNGIAITLNVQTKENTNSLEVTLSAATVAALSNAKVTQFTIHNGLTGITFDLTALGALAGGEVKLTISKVDVNSLSTEAGNAIGSRPVFRFGASVDGRAVTDFKGGRVSLQMPYIRSTTEQSGNLCGVYVDDNGKVTWLENSSYDSTSGNMLTSATHFSIYGVGYKQNTPGFTDVDTHWAKNDIDFVVARGLLTGADSTTFAPEQSMTRGMFVTALGRLANIDTSQYANTTFTDVAPAAYYAPYAAWADASGIVNGTTDTTFSPDNAITRQEMAVMLVNYNKAIGYKLPVVHTEVTFTDAGNIASWAKDAVRQMQMAGILMGKSGNRFEPTAAATRAEASATLRRYVGLVVNPTPLTLLE